MILKTGVMKEGVIEQVEAAYDAHALDLEFVDLYYLKKIVLEGVIEKIKQTVTFRGKLTSQIEQVCARCLASVQSDIITPFDLFYEIEGRETIDATDDLRDILILNHPNRFLCNADCRGICAHCGTNLNRESCSCQNSVRVAPHWEQLKDQLKRREN